MTPKPYNIAIIGYGLSAKVFHIPLIQGAPELKLYAVVQRTPKPNDDAEKDHPGIKSYRSGEEMVQDSEVEVVVVTTAPTSHFELGKLALEHGKHVIIEKPFTPSSKEASELIAIAKKHDRLLTVYQNRRWDTDFLTLSKLLDQKALGRVVEFETHYDRHRPDAPDPTSTWKAKFLPGGGAVYDLGTHLIDQAVVAFGPPDKITGFVGSQREHNPGEVEDSCTILLHYDSGLLTTVKAAVVSPEENQLRYWVRGDMGSYKKFHIDPQEDHLKAGKKPGDSGFGIESKERAGTLTTVQGGQPKTQTCANIEPVTYSAFYSQFSKALAGQDEVPVKPETPRDVIRLIELARLSSKEGRTLDIREGYAEID
ncbi:MAG: hypothetical protein ALECFALPRED_007263 [Alectoria fallacina]|uniref:Uncharacterized protein n=1 Tax=Alectoria fallacina TaxID=1903189 RepID=A0A8H3IZS3_9LECA|nr:MAG: hypothetical protein ALECFALPRED_007263 [Alectoria fallacina]